MLQNIIINFWKWSQVELDLYFFNILYKTYFSCKAFFSTKGQIRYTTRWGVWCPQRYSSSFARNDP